MELLCSIRALQQAITQFEYLFEQRCGLNLNEGMALCTLIRHGGLCSGKLGTALGISPSHTSKLLRALERKGLVSCTFGCEDRRQMRYTATAAGLQLLQHLDFPRSELPELLRKSLGEEA